MNRKRLAVVLEDTIHLYDIENMKSLHILETAANPKGASLWQCVHPAARSSALGESKHMAFGRHVQAWSRSPRRWTTCTSPTRRG